MIKTIPTFIKPGRMLYWRLVSVLVILWLTAGYSLAGGNIMKLHDVEAQAGDTITIKLEIINEEDFIGFNLDIPLPADFQYVEGSEQLYRDDGHYFTFGIREGNVARMLSVSMQSKPFAGHDGIIASFDVISPRVPVNLSLSADNAVIGNVSARNILTSTIDAGITLTPP